MYINLIKFVWFFGSCVCIFNDYWLEFIYFINIFQFHCDHTQITRHFFFYFFCFVDLDTHTHVIIGFNCKKWKVRSMNEFKVVLKYHTVVRVRALAVSMSCVWVVCVVFFSSSLTTWRARRHLLNAENQVSNRFARIQIVCAFGSSIAFAAVQLTIDRKRACDSSRERGKKTEKKHALSFTIWHFVCVISTEC